MKYMKLECMNCGNLFPFTHFHNSCKKCGCDWFIEVYNYEEVKDELSKLLDGNITSLWKYFPVLPIQNQENIVTFDEGGTPLIKSRYLGKKLGIDLYIKDEGCKPPTYTFKDRGGTLAISALKEIGAEEFAIYTTGNIGIAVTYYCQKANIKAKVFCQKIIEARKREIIRQYGGDLVEINGTYDDAQNECKKYARENNVYCDKGAKSLYRRASKKTMAYEIFEQLENRSPNWYFQSVSGGLGPIGVARGFEELKIMGFIDELPRIGCIQMEGCNPMVQSFKKDIEEITVVSNPMTKILTLATGNPMSYPYVFRAVKTTKGIIDQVRDDDASEMVDILNNEEGILASEAAAVSMAGIKKLSENNFFRPGEIVVFACTGRY